MLTRMLAQEIRSLSSEWYHAVPLPTGKLPGRGKALETSPEPSQRQQRQKQPRRGAAAQRSGTWASHVAAASPWKPWPAPVKVMEEPIAGPSSSQKGSDGRGRSISPASAVSTASSLPSSLPSLPSTPSRCNSEHDDLAGFGSISPVPAELALALVPGSRPPLVSDGHSHCGMSNNAAAKEAEPDVAALLSLKNRLAERIREAQPGPFRADSGADVAELQSLRLRLANALRETDGGGASTRSSARSAGAAPADPARRIALPAQAESAASPRVVAVVRDGLAYLLPPQAPNVLRIAGSRRFS